MSSERAGDCRSRCPRQEFAKKPPTRMTKKSILVTGATDGIGLETSKRLVANSGPSSATRWMIGNLMPKTVSSTKTGALVQSLHVTAEIRRDFP